MPRINFREAQRFFGHVDATCAGYKIASDEGCYYSAHFYPFWLHPLYQREQTPFFHYPEEAKVVFTVHAINIIQAHIEAYSQVIDWGFAFDDPLLREFENTGQAFINSPVSVEQAQQLCRILETQDARVLQNDTLLSLLIKWGQKPPFALGTLPRTEYIAVCNALDQLGIAWYGTKIVPEKALPIIFRADNSYMIATDFEVEFPDIAHDPAWMQGKEYKGALNPD